MKATEAGFVALRLIGLLMLIYGLLGLVSALSFFQYGAPGGFNYNWIGKAQILAYLVELVLATYLFVHARKVSRFLFGSADDLELTPPLESVQAIGFSVLGAYFAALALPQLGATLAQFVWVLRGGAELEREAFLDLETFLDVLYNLISLVAGIFLFVRSRWLAGLWSRSQVEAEPA